MKIIILVALVASQVLTSEINPLSDEFINYINSKQNTWIAGRNFDENTSIGEIKKLLGNNPNDPRKETARKFVHPEDTDIPESFDAREHWPECKDVISHITDQSACGSGWAVSAASVMSDRRCIHSKGKLQIPVSAVYIAGCRQDNFDRGCHGGYPFTAFSFWYVEGAVTGGYYGSSQGCQPYTMEPCDHYINGTKKPCTDLHYDDPVCKKECDDSSLVYQNELTFGADQPTFFDVATNIQREILTNGPVATGFELYSDFLNYKSGVYQHTAGDFLGGHAVRIIGWGVENNVPYWLVANSWNEEWGDNGLFKIIRGINELIFEEEATASMPKIDEY